jgi:hypothetical protein
MHVYEMHHVMAHLPWEIEAKGDGGNRCILESKPFGIHHRRRRMNLCTEFIEIRKK